VLTADEIVTALKGGYESRRLEVKGPGGFADSHLVAKVARAMLSMANMRDGGHVIIGIDDTDVASLQPGMPPDVLSTWTFDALSAKLATYADPPLRFELASVELPPKTTVLVIEVMEFQDLPHLCAKSYDDIRGKPVLRQGALYVRPRKKAETSEVATSVEMREILDLASEKRLRDLLGTVARSGGAIVSVTAGSADTDQLFDAERQAAWK
jgi:predicted HTH transcriptional regulator